MPSLLHTFTSTSRPSELFEAAWCHMLWSQHLLCFETAAVLPRDNTDHFLGWLSLLLLILSSWIQFRYPNLVKLNFFIHEKGSCYDWRQSTEQFLNYFRTHGNRIQFMQTASSAKDKKAKVSSKYTKHFRANCSCTCLFSPFVFSTSLLNYLLMLILSLLIVIYNQY